MPLWRHTSNNAICPTNGITSTLPKLTKKGNAASMPRGEARFSSLRFAERVLKMLPPHEPLITIGRDVFHRVPKLAPKDGDAVERVPTGFRGSMHELFDESSPLGRGPG